LKIIGKGFGALLLEFEPRSPTAYAALLPLDNLKERGTDSENSQ